MRIYQVLFTAVGFACVALGAIALLLPLVPTTPFLLLGGICLARGSQRHREWLQKLPIISRYWPAKWKASESPQQQPA